MVGGGGGLKWRVHRSAQGFVAAMLIRRPGNTGRDGPAGEATSTVAFRAGERLETGGMNARSR